MTTRVYLIGLMGCGKTTVGRRLAVARGVDYVDNDATIAALAGTTTLDLARQGGTVLHDWESRYTRDLIGRSGAFVAGVPASTANRADELAGLGAAGLLVYLRCPPDVLAARVAADPPRPWLPPDPAPMIDRMYAHRDPILRGCGLVVDGTAAPAAIVGTITARLADGVSGADAS